jgi:excisionase family DNA binding protein
MSDSDRSPSHCPPPTGGRDPSPTMTVPELAERVGVELSTAYRYLRAGRLPGVQVGSSWLIDRGRVERFMAGYEDAAGRILIQDPPPSGPVGLTLLPGRPPESEEIALLWLRGAHAAFDLLLGAAAQQSATVHEERRVIGA